MGHLRRTSNYPKRIIFFDLNHMMKMIDHFSNYVKIPRIDNRCSLEKGLTKLIHMNPSMVLYLPINHVDSFHGCVCGPLT